VTESSSAEARYHHGDLRAALMAAAVEGIAAHGVEKLSLRALAREVGVSPAAPYRHFESKNALLGAVALEGVNELRDVLKKAHGEGSAYKCLLAAGLGYVEYALTHPVQFQLIFGNVVGEFSQYQGLREAANEAYEVLLDLLADDARRMNRPVHEMGAVIWTAYHGLAGLLIGAADNPLKGELMPREQALAWLRESTRSALALMLRSVLSR
jgi:AcrR family transcriptional regulator